MVEKIPEVEAEIAVNEDEAFWIRTRENLLSDTKNHHRAIAMNSALLKFTEEQIKEEQSLNK